MEKIKNYFEARGVKVLEVEMGNNEDPTTMVKVRDTDKARRILENNLSYGYFRMPGESALTFFM